MTLQTFRGDKKDRLSKVLTLERATYAGPGGNISMSIQSNTLANVWPLGFANGGGVGWSKWVGRCKLLGIRLGPVRCLKKQKQLF